MQFNLRRLLCKQPGHDEFTQRGYSYLVEKYKAVDGSLYALLHPAHDMKEGLWVEITVDTYEPTFFCGGDQMLSQDDRMQVKQELLNCNLAEAWNTTLPNFLDVTDFITPN